MSASHKKFGAIRENVCCGKESKCICHVRFTFFSFSFIQSIIVSDRLPVDCKSAKNTSGSGV